MVVSMRPYPPEAIEQVRDLTRPFIRTHGEPIAWGPEGAAALGIDDPTGQRPDFGDASEIRDGEVPVFWGYAPYACPASLCTRADALRFVRRCGVTPQLSVMDSKIPEIVCGHSPGHMLVLDIRDEDVCE